MVLWAVYMPTTVSWRLANGSLGKLQWEEVTVAIAAHKSTQLRVHPHFYWPPPGRRLGREGAIRLWKSSSQGSDPGKRWFIPLVSTGMLTSDSCDLGCRTLSLLNTALRSLIGRTPQGTASARSRSPILSPPTGAGCLRESLILRLDLGNFQGSGLTHRYIHSATSRRTCMCRKYSKQVFSDP